MTIKEKIKVFTFVLMIAVVLTALFISSKNADNINHLDILENLRSGDALVAKLQQQVLVLQNGLIDKKVETLPFSNGILKSIDKLKQEKYRLYLHGQPGIDASIDEIIAETNKLDRAVQQFLKQISPQIDAEIYLQGKKNTSDIALNSIFNSTQIIAKHIDNIRETYLADFKSKQELEKYYKLGIFLISLILLLIIMSYMLRLRSSEQSLRSANTRLTKENAQRNKVEHIQKQQSAFLESVLDNITDAVAACDKYGNIKLLNRTARKMFGFTTDFPEINSWQNYCRFYDAENKEISEPKDNPLIKTLRGEDVKNVEILIRPKLGQPISAIVNAERIIDDQGETFGAVISIRDVTAMKAAEVELRISAVAFEAHEAIMITDHETNIVRVNERFRDLTGFSLDEVYGQKPSLFKSGLHDQDFYKQMWRDLNLYGYWQGEIYNKKKSGDIFPEWLSISVVKDKKGQISHYVSHFRDITEIKLQEEHIRRTVGEEKVLSKLLQLSFEPLELFLQHAAEELVSVDWLNILPHCGIFLNENNGEGWVLKLIANHNLPMELVESCTKVSFGKCFCGKAAAEQQLQFINYSENKSSERCKNMAPQGHFNVPILDGEKVLGVIVLFVAQEHQQKDYEANFLKRVADTLSLCISRKQAEAQAQYLAYHDGLTKLPNRLLLIDRLKQIIASDKRNNRYSALMYIDFDRFKNINDSLGHPVGDALLIEIAKRFSRIVRAEDTVARLGGDEFVVVITDIVPEHDAAILEARTVAEKLQATIAEEFHVMEHVLFTSLSAGIVIITGEESDPDTLLMQADTAMYKAKESGRDKVKFFLPEMQDVADKRLNLEKELRYALERDELHLFYQPQFNQHNELFGAEALLRWQHKKHGMISPADFIPIAEETGLILPIGEWVLHTACEQIKAWQHLQGFRHISVNVSPAQFRQADFVETVKHVVAATRIDPKKLTLEITEGIMVSQGDEVIKKMAALKRLGVHFSIDDFGTGFSSLAYLKRFPVDQLKIDKSFVDDICSEDENAQVIIETIIVMAERLGFEIIAEGVETKEQLTFLKSRKCWNYQGYYFSKALERKDFEHKYLALTEMDGDK